MEKMRPSLENQARGRKTARKDAQDAGDLLSSPLRAASAEASRPSTLQTPLAAPTARELGSGRNTAFDSTSTVMQSRWVGPVGLFHLEKEGMEIYTTPPLPRDGWTP